MYLLGVRGGERGGTLATAHRYKSEDNLKEVPLSFHDVGPNSGSGAWQQAPLSTEPSCCVSKALWKVVKVAAGYLTTLRRCGQKVLMILWACSKGSSSFTSTEWNMGIQCSKEPPQSNQGGGLQWKRRLDWTRVGGTLESSNQFCFLEIWLFSQ